MTRLHDEAKPVTLTHEGDAYVQVGDNGQKVSLLFMPIEGKDNLYVAQFGGNFLIGGVVRRRGAHDDTATESQGLGCGAGTGQGFELGAKFVRQLDNRTEGARHGSPPDKLDQLVPLLVIMATHAPGG